MTVFGNPQNSMFNWFLQAYGTICVNDVSISLHSCTKNK